MDYPPPSRILAPTASVDFLLLGPGPSNVSQRVRHAASLNLEPFLMADFGRTLDDVSAGLKFAFQTQNEYTYAITASGKLTTSLLFKYVVLSRSCTFTIGNLH